MKKGILTVLTTALILGFVLYLIVMMVMWYLSSLAPKFTHTATILKVVDGDTVYLKETIEDEDSGLFPTNKIHLASIDAPESDFYLRSQDPWNNNAKNYLAKLLPVGTEVTIKPHDFRVDKDGYLLAQIYKGDLDINKEMVRQGHAVTYFTYPDMTNYFTEYQTAYLEAKQAGRGMWNPSNPINELPFEFRDRIVGNLRHKYIGNYELKTYVYPADYKQIPIEKRIFFTDLHPFPEYTQKDSGQSTPDLVINEVLPAPSTKFSKEFVEIYNPTNSSIDLSGYYLDHLKGDGYLKSDGYTTHPIPYGTTIPANGYYVCETTNFFNDKGDTVILKALNGRIVAEYTYTTTDQDVSWFRLPNGGSWASFQHASPTKGTPNF